MYHLYFCICLSETLPLYNIFKVFYPTQWETENRLMFGLIRYVVRKPSSKHSCLSFKIPTSGITMCTFFFTLDPEKYPEILRKRVQISLNPSFSLYSTAVSVCKPEGNRQLEVPSVDGRIILRWIFRKWDVGPWTGSSWLTIGTGGGRL